MIWAQYYQRDTPADPWRECLGSDQILRLDARWNDWSRRYHANKIGAQRYANRPGQFGFRLFRGQWLNQGFALTAQVIPMESTP
jgi:hypothetical protein